MQTDIWHLILTSVPLVSKSEGSLHQQLLITREDAHCIVVSAIDINSKFRGNLLLIAYLWFGFGCAHRQKWTRCVREIQPHVTHVGQYQTISTEALNHPNNSGKCWGKPYWVCSQLPASACHLCCCWHFLNLTVMMYYRGWMCYKNWIPDGNTLPLQSYESCSVARGFQLLKLPNWSSSLPWHLLSCCCISVWLSCIPCPPPSPCSGHCCGSSGVSGPIGHVRYSTCTPYI